MLEAELTETTVEDKICRLVSLFTSVPFEEITGAFDLKTQIDKADPDYFNTMMADALAMHFEVPTEQEDIANCNTVQDLIDRASQ